MNNTIETINKIIELNKQARADNNYYLLLMNAQSILEEIPNLINLSVNYEHKYRVCEAKMVEDPKMTASRAEIFAKATEDYKEWQKIKQTIDLMYEMVQVAKRLAVDVEFNRKHLI